MNIRNRLTKIYTRTGDEGTTGLGYGSRIDKDSLRVPAKGEVDHLNDLFKTVLSQTELSESVKIYHADVQHDLFDLGAELCISGSARITDMHVGRLKPQLDQMNANFGRFAA